MCMHIITILSQLSTLKLVFSVILLIQGCIELPKASCTLRPDYSRSKDSRLYKRIALEHKRCYNVSVYIAHISVAHSLIHTKLHTASEQDGFKFLQYVTEYM